MTSGPAQSLKNSEITFDVPHVAFKPVKISIPVDWAMDPYDNRNWRHYFISLRWFSGVSPNAKIAFLNDFYNFHFVRKRPNNMLTDLIGDHAAALRLDVVGKLYNKAIRDGEQSTADLCERIMRKDIVMLLTPKIYRAGHNHGVMADTAILETLDRLQSADQDIRETVIRRGTESQAQLFDDDGITREHSISYQEYNYPIVMRFWKAAANHLTDSHRNKQKKLAHATREMLGHFTRANGQFFALGDSFRLPNASIRKQYPEIDSRSTALDDNDRLFCKGGFFSYARNTTSPRLHFVAIACWNSQNHKQDDDLSFCLEIDGKMIFDDPGYTFVVKTAEMALLSSANIHSTVTVQDVEFGSRKDAPSGTGFHECSQHARGFILNGSHARIPGLVINRRWYLTGNRLSIVDSIHGQLSDATMSQHSFVLATDIKFVEIDRRIHLIRDDSLVGVLQADDESGSWSAAMVPYAAADKSMGQTMRLTYTAPANIGHSFCFSFD